MSVYYVAGFPYSDDLYYSGVQFGYGNVICHGRTKGSRNGISTTPGYRAIGKPANTDRYKTNDVRKTEKKTYVTSNVSKGSSFGKTMLGTSSQSTSSKKTLRSGGKSRKASTKSTTDSTRKMAKTASRIIRNYRRAEKEGGTSFASNLGKPQVGSIFTKPRPNSPINMTGYYGPYSLSSLYEARERQSVKNLEKAQKKKEKAVKKLVNRIQKDAKMSEIKASIKESAKKVGDFVSKCGKTVVSSIKITATSAAGKVKKLFSRIFGKK